MKHLYNITDKRRKHLELNTGKKNIRKEKNMKNYKLISVQWKDSTFYNGWYRDKVISEYGLKKMETIGFLIEETKEFIKVAQSREITEEDNISDIICIPKVNIIKMNYINETKTN